jgi:hypothetical protein
MIFLLRLHFLIFKLFFDVSSKMFWNSVTHWFAPFKSFVKSEFINSFNFFCISCDLNDSLKLLLEWLSQMYWFGNLVISILHPGLVSGFSFV